MIYKPHLYQSIAEAHILNTDYCGLILDMGLGKTVVTATALRKLLRCEAVKRPLIIAPKLVAEQTWTEEFEKWDHLQGMKVSRIIGTVKQRLAAIAEPADVYIVSRDNIAWLVEHMGRRWPFDALVIDESSSFKSQSSARFKAVKKIRGHLKRVILLTGTPASNSLLDLWPQIFLLDGGQRLGNTIGGYRQRYFQREHVDQYQIKYTVWPNAAAKIHQKISDICISMKAKDWLDLPERIDRVRPLVLDDIEAYRTFQRKKVLELTGAEITPLNAAGLYGKLLQFCNGAVYDADKQVHVVNDTKLEALSEEIEALQGKSVIVFYQFKSDLARIRKLYPDSVVLKSGSKPGEAKRVIEQWNAGKIDILIAHAASAGHGLNLQYGGYNLIWYGLPWSLELYLQAVTRVDRQGQTQSVLNKILITKGTVEELVWARLQSKEIAQDELIEAINVERWLVKDLRQFIRNAA